jgi:hypothetical protein
LLIECKLQGRKWQVAENGCFISVEKSHEAFLLYYCSGGMSWSFVVITRLEKRVIVATLELQASFEDLGWDIYK